MEASNIHMLGYYTTPSNTLCAVQMFHFFCGFLVGGGGDEMREVQ